MTAAQLSTIYNFLPISEDWATAGQPTAGQLAALKEAGFDVVINLGMPDSPHAVPEEADLVTAQGMEYIPIPVVWEEPTTEDLRQFFVAMDASAEKRRFVHCIANMRVSAFTFLYRVIVQGVPVDEARQSMRQIWDPNPIWQDFIEEQLAEHGLEWE